MGLVEFWFTNNFPAYNNAMTLAIREMYPDATVETRNCRDDQAQNYLDRPATAAAAHRLNPERREGFLQRWQRALVSFGEGGSDRDARNWAALQSSPDARDGALARY
jgi:hypothetical protein